MVHRKHSDTHFSVLLAIESSCDETAVAIIAEKTESFRLLSSLVSSQIDIHRAYGGVVPEVACRNHAVTLPPLVAQALEAAGVTLAEISAFAATRGPGLASSLLVGFSYAKALAAASGKPFFGVNHMEGHLLSPFLGQKKIPPHLSLIVSGGHTLLIDVAAYGNYRLLGRTRDDAAGEAFDKVGRMLGLPYPGGPEIEKAARAGDPTAFAFPRALMHEANHDFSFSGLKTAVRYTLEKIDDPQNNLADLCASFQKAVSDALVQKTLRAATETGHRLITLSGGVACNQTIQENFRQTCAQNGLTFLSTTPALTTDNAGMIAYAAQLAQKNRQPDSLTLPIQPNLALAS